MDTQTVYLNADTNPFGEHAAAIALNCWTVVNAPRPLPGEIHFQGEFRHGVFYSAGPRDRYDQAWADLDAWPVTLITNLEIVERLRTMAVERKTTLRKVLEWKRQVESGEVSSVMPRSA